MTLFLLLRRPKPLPATLILITIRFMGGGPRTFPGGLNKWQYKRMHEKLAKEKEHKLLSQEKQLYQARLRSEIRAKVASNQQSQPSNPPDSSNNYSGMSSKEHIKMLADRFMKRGAEDLWNEDDGPIRLERSRDSEAKPLDLKKIVKDGRSSMRKLGSFEQKREYSKLRRNLSSGDEDEGLYGNDGGLIGLETRELNLKKLVKDGRRGVEDFVSFEGRGEFKVEEESFMMRMRMMGY